MHSTLDFNFLNQKLILLRYIYQYGITCIFSRMLAELFMLDYYISEYGYTWIADWKYCINIADWLGCSVLQAIGAHTGVGKMTQLHHPISNIWGSQGKVAALATQMFCHREKMWKCIKVFCASFLSNFPLFFLLAFFFITHIVLGSTISNGLVHFVLQWQCLTRACVLCLPREYLTAAAHYQAPAVLSVPHFLPLWLNLQNQELLSVTQWQPQSIHTQTHPHTCSLSCRQPLKWSHFSSIRTQVEPECEWAALPGLVLDFC